MPSLYVVSDTDFNAPVKLAVDGETSGSGSTDSTESNASINASNHNAESDFDCHDLPLQNATDVNLELPDVNLEWYSLTALTEHDALTARESQLQKSA